MANDEDSATSRAGAIHGPFGPAGPDDARRRDKV